MENILYAALFYWAGKEAGREKNMTRENDLFQSAHEGNEESLMLLTEKLITGNWKQINRLIKYEVIPRKPEAVGTFFFQEVKNYITGTLYNPENDKGYRPEKSDFWNFHHSHRRGWGRWQYEVNKGIGKEENNIDFENQSITPINIFKNFGISEEEKTVEEKDILKKVYDYLGVKTRERFEDQNKGDFMFNRRTLEKAEKWGKKNHLNKQ
jgi:hypothetical protein